MINRKYRIIIFNIMLVLLVVGCNHKPMIDSIKINQEVLLAGDSTEIMITVNDEDQDHLSYEWLATGGSIEGDEQGATYTASEQPGTYQIKLIVTDAKGASVVITKEIRVKQIELEIISSSEQGYITENLELEAKSNLREDELNYSWSSKEGEIIGTGAEVEYKLSQISGTYPIELTVQDENGLEVTKQVKIEVKNKYQIERLIAEPETITIDDQQQRVESLINLRVDNFGDLKLDYQWSAKYGKIITQNNQMIYQGPAQNIIDQIRVEVSDQYGNQLVATTDIKVIHVWQKSYGGEDNEAFEGVTEVKDGYLVAGYSNSLNYDGIHPASYLLKLNDQGDIQLQKYDYLPGEEDIFFDVAKMEDNNYLVTGHKSNSNSLFINGYLMKVNQENGQRIIEYFPEYELTNQQLYEVKLASNGDSLVVGYINDYGNDGYFLRLSEEGDNLSYIYNHDRKQGSNDYFNDVIDSEDGYLLTGYSSYFGAKNGNALVVKLNQDGRKEFAYTYGEEHLDERFESIIATQDGYLLAGARGSTEDLNYDGYLVKVDVNGKEIFNYTYGKGNSDEGFRKIISCEDGGYLLIGYSNSSTTQDYDGYVVKVNQVGEELWSRFYGGKENDEFMDGLAIKKGGYLLVGYTNSFGQGARDGYIVKIDQNGRTGLSQE